MVEGVNSWMVRRIGMVFFHDVTRRLSGSLDSCMVVSIVVGRVFPEVGGGVGGLAGCGHIVP